MMSTKFLGISLKSAFSVTEGVGMNTDYILPSLYLNKEAQVFTFR